MDYRFYFRKTEAKVKINKFILFSFFPDTIWPLRHFCYLFIASVSFGFFRFGQQQRSMASVSVLLLDKHR